MKDDIKIAGQETRQGDSFTFTVVDVNGFDGLYTLREKADEVDFLTRVKSESLALKEAKFIPKPKFVKGGFLPKEREWTGEKCPKCGGRLYHIVTKSGKDMCKCEKSTFINGVAGGCDTVIWGKNIADANKRQAEWEASHQTSDEQTY